MTAPFIEIQAVSKRFDQRVSLGDQIAGALGSPVEKRPVRAVQDVSLGIARGEVLGLVGESGCGKSTLGRMIAGILPPTAGTVAIEGAPVMTAGTRPRKRTTRVQMIFQDPYASLDPRMRVGDAIAEGPIVHRLVARSDAASYVGGWLQKVGLEPGAAQRYPHQFSGGQRQRIAIARALAMRPDVLVCDEPVASLDVSIQAQVINLLQDLQHELGLAYLFVAHDLSVVKHTSDRVAVMYLGRIVEEGDKSAIYDTPMHPYTQALLSAVPRHDVRGREGGRLILQGEIPSPANPPGGCRFHPRCFKASARCATDPPVLEPHPGIASRRACHHAGPLAAAGGGA
jgi:oligopeptide/dipeptide ABC transporter ATP-binding protein